MWRASMYYGSGDGIFEIFVQQRRSRFDRENFYRPTDPEIAAKYAKQFQPLELVKIDQLGGWNVAQNKHFADGGVFDQIYGPGK